MRFTRTKIVLAAVVALAMLGLITTTSAQAATTSYKCGSWVGHTSKSVDPGYDYAKDTFSSRICISLTYTSHNDAITKLRVEGHSNKQYYEIDTSAEEYSVNKSKSKTYKTSYGQPWDNTTKGYVRFGGTKTLPSHQYMWFKVSVTMKANYKVWKYTQTTPKTRVD